ncbi:TetR/AcrR family transcriptional regulator [Corynebacterium sp. NPDC060344]|uniref:TetR/AcrR family transcriptional regulator n=1 Tax=Corynebacterium sp. NPDC060344 TaxID=3347101 RepID=UPI00365D6544
MSVDQRRASLVEAALEIAIEDGVGAVTTRNVCSRANAHLSVFHYCFSGKGELVGLMIRRTLSNLTGGFVHDGVDDVASLIRHAHRLLATHWDEAFTLYELVVASARVEHGSENPPKYFAGFADGMEMLLALYAERDGYAWAPGTRAVSELIVTFLGGAGVGWVSDHVSTPSESSSEDLLDVFITMIEGLKVPA